MFFFASIAGNIMSELCTQEARPPHSAFIEHFHREPDPGNAHDAACLNQIEMFTSAMGRAPNTRNRADLALLQRIAPSAAQEPVAAVAETPPPATYHGALDQLEVAMMGLPAVEMPVVHRFTPGLYVREIFMAAGTLLTSKIHKTEHPYVVSKGRVSVLTEGWNSLRRTRGSPSRERGGCFTSTRTRSGPRSTRRC